MDITYWKQWIEQKLCIKKYISFDMETTGLDIYKDDIHFCNYDLNGKRGHFIMRPDLVKHPVIPKEVRHALEDEDVTVIIQSSQFDAPMFRLKTGIRITNIWDTQIVETVLLGGKFEISQWDDTSLKTILKRYKIADISKEVRNTFIDYKGPITKKQLNYGDTDIKYLRKLAQMQLERAEELDLVNVVKLENRTCEVTAELRFNGIKFDEQYWIDCADALNEEYNNRIYALPKKVANWNSEKQIKAYFLKDHGIKIESLSDLPNVRNKVLDKFKHARELYKACTSYGFGFLKRKWKKRQGDFNTVDPDGRIRGGYTQIVETGRYSSSNPNLQNIPAFGIGHELAAYIDYLKAQMFVHRHAFIADKGNLLCVGDFTGQELGVIAAGSKDSLWINAMRAGHDLHSVMANKIYSDWLKVGEKGCKYPFKCDCPEHKKRRRPAKDLNFGLAYGKGAESFAREAGMKLSDAYKIIRKYKRSIPKVVDWLERNGDFAVKKGWIRTLPPFRRLRYCDGEDWKKRNRGKNTPVQGSGADMMKLAMCMIHKYIYDMELFPDVKMVLTVHDELLTEVSKSIANKWAKTMKYFMEEAAMFITGDKLVTTDPELMTQWKLKL